MLCKARKELIMYRRGFWKDRGGDEENENLAESSESTNITEKNFTRGQSQSLWSPKRNFEGWKSFHNQKGGSKQDWRVHL